jgi:hypothetical protein
MILGELGGINPYSTNKKTVADIEPTDAEMTTMLQNGDIKPSDIARYIQTGIAFIDKSNGEPNDPIGWTGKNHIEKVDWLRQEIQKEISNLHSVWRNRTADVDMSAGGLMFFYRNNVLKYLTEARFWLGFELQRVREESK